MLTPKEQTVRGHYKIGGTDWFGTYKELESKIQTPNLFDQIRNDQILVHVGWRGQADLGFVNIVELTEGHTVVQIR